MSEDNYTAKNIRILTNAEISEFEWVKCSDLAAKHKKPLTFIERGFECCRRLGIEPDYFINKYLKKKSITPMPEFEKVYKEILQEEKEKMTGK